MSSEEPVTLLLQQWSEGNKEALDRLMPIVYAQLRKLAAHALRRERPNHTLRATELVHEAYLKLIGSETPWQSRAHFYAVAATVLRHILVDHAKSNRRQKRGGDAEKIPLDEAVLVGPEVSWEVVNLDEAMKRLAVSDTRKSQIVELTFFGGMTLEEIAAVLNISDKTVHRELRVAKAWLHRELRPEGAGSA
ncbi:MAG: sigma-70 family RNA polymerase sigma factor [Terriglobales bacterium]|jgi:RNA polymerase sigma-70 factor (ECF subfamily)